MPRRLAAPLVLVGLLACGRDVVFVDPPPPSGDTDSTGTDTTDTDTTIAQRVDLTITVTVDPADTALATRLGLVNGRLAGAEVTATRVLGLQEPQSGITDSLGQLTLPRLIAGFWAISVFRSLSAEERALLDSADLDVSGFVGTLAQDVTPAAAQVTLTTRAARRGTLVISEAHIPVDNMVTGYVLAQYIEVHNNSGDTIYLDGKIFGLSLPWVWGTLNVPDCADWAQWLEDPDGIWTRWLWAFPGAGRTYPLQPGESAVVAVDAIDHRAIRSELLDLRGADFEFIGVPGTDVDNPAVPNMAEFPGYSDFGDDILGHGPWWGNEVSVFLADPVNPYVLPEDNLPVQTPGHVRVPRDKILDVLTSGRLPDQQPPRPYCPNFVHPSFDGRFAQLVDGASLNYSLVRLPLAGSPPELPVLQRTKVSAVDFVRRAPSPGQAP